MQDFPQAGGFGDARLIMSQNTSNYLQEEPTNNNQQDIVQEILSVAQASQNFMNQETTWGGGSYINHHQQDDDDNDFSFLSQNDQLMYDVKFTDKILREDQSFMMRSIQIGNMNNEEELKSADGMIENLRWVGMSDKDLEKVRT